MSRPRQSFKPPGRCRPCEGVSLTSLLSVDICTPGEGVGDWAKHHWLISAAYEESELSGCEFPFATCFSGFEGAGSGVFGERNEYDGGGDGGGAKD